MLRIKNISLVLLLCALLPISPVSIAAVDVSGTYISKYTSKQGGGKPVVFLNQNGSKITAQLDWDQGDEIDGTIENGVIKFNWWAPRFSYERRGSLKILDDGKRIEGTWYTHGGNSTGEWTLIRDEGALPTNLYDDPNVSRFETKLEAMKLQAPGKPLSGFAQFQLAEMTVDEKIQDMYAFTEKVREFEGKLTASIIPLMDQWNAHGDQGTGTLLVKPHLHSFKMVSSETREAGLVVDAIISGLAGNSHIELELVLVDASDDKELSRVTIRKDTGDIVQAAATNLTSLSVYDHLVIDYVAAISYEYLAGNNELTQIAISSSSPAAGNVLSEDSDSVPVEFIGIAATEVASKTYDKDLWAQSIELAKGDPEKQSGIYITLRSKQLAEKADRGSHDNVNLVDVSGTWISDITTSTRFRFKKAEERRLEIIITQKGNEITGINKSKNLKISGVREGNEISFFTWPSDISMDEIKGKWIVKPDGRIIEGTWTHPHGGGKWNLKRSE